VSRDCKTPAAMVAAPAQETHVNYRYRGVNPDVWRVPVRSGAAKVRRMAVAEWSDDREAVAGALRPVLVARAVSYCTGRAVYRERGHWEWT
jgi:hypothetical protein